MPLTSDVLRLDEARRIALHAQGFADPRPAGQVDRRHLRRVLDRVGVVQIDSVNVLTRSHELPFLARLGPYPRERLAGWLWGSGEVFEYWAHEASLLPVELHPLLRWRMAEDHAWSSPSVVAAERPELVEALLTAIAERGRSPWPSSSTWATTSGARRPAPERCGTGPRPRRPSSTSSGGVWSAPSGTRSRSAATT